MSWEGDKEWIAIPVSDGDLARAADQAAEVLNHLGEREPFIAAVTLLAAELHRGDRDRAWIQPVDRTGYELGPLIVRQWPRVHIDDAVVGLSRAAAADDELLTDLGIGPAGMRREWERLSRGVMTPQTEQLKAIAPVLRPDAGSGPEDRVTLTTEQVDAYRHVAKAITGGDPLEMWSTVGRVGMASPPPTATISPAGRSGGTPAQSAGARPRPTQMAAQRTLGSGGLAGPGGLGR